MRTPNQSQITLPVLLFVPLVAYGALTDLSTTPLSGATSTEIKPNILFVMDDSGSMDWDYMPDWAGNTTERWKRRNASFNGVAYNPAISYTPPRYFDADGSSNTTTYPSQTAAATSDWTAVKNDGYGIQSPLTGTGSTSILAGRAFYYTTVPGEFCTNKTLKTCSTTQDATYTEPARLRWCTTDANAVAATPAAGTCQAIQVESTGSNTAYTFPRMPSPRQSTISISGSSSTSVSGITVGGLQILSTAVAATTAPLTMATDLAARINDCTFGRTGNCQTEGYSAEVSGNNVILRAPGAIASTPSVSKSGTMTVNPSAFARPAPYTGSGDNLLTVIAPSITSYPKASTRSDCAGTDCTYAEEMTNFANWWAYYRTRMQAMKTAASRSFEPIIDKYRIGYYSINNNTTSDFLNISDFNNSQKKSWYDKLFAAKPDLNTPLRVALSNAGRLYAGKLSTLNGVSVVDPVQYFCQQNVTILSTDGYWNEGAGFEIDGATPVGDQDGPGLEVRPQLDGGEPQIRTNTLQHLTTYVPETPWLQKRTEQQKKQTAVIERRDKENQVSNSTLQKRLGQWQTQEWQLESRAKTTPLTSTLTQEQARTKALQRRTGTLQRQTSTLQKRTKTQTQESLSILQSQVIQRQQLEYRLQYNLTQVQRRTSSDYGETWGSWANVASCTTDNAGADRTQCQTLAASGWTNVEGSSYTQCQPATGGSQTFNAGTDSQYTVYTSDMQCRYRNTTSADNWPNGSTWTNTPSCTDANPTTASPFTVLTARKCQDTYPSGWQDTTSCTTSETLRCQYKDWGSYVNATSCTAQLRDTGPNFTGPARQCRTGQWTPWANATETCDKVTNSVECQYTNWSSGTNDATCTAEPQSTGDSLSTLAARQCVVNWGNWGNQTSCTTQSTGGTRTECRYATNWTGWSNVASCTASGTAGTAAGTPLGSETSYTGPARECQTVWTTPAASGPCTPDPGATACTTQWTGWADVPNNGSCTATTENGDANSPDNSVECRYRLAQDWHNTASCSSNPRSAPSGGFPKTYSVNRATDCRVAWPTDANANWVNLTSGDTCNSALTDTQCRYSGWTNYVADPTCTAGSAINQSVAPNYTVVTARQCRNDWGSWQSTGLTSKPADTASTQYQLRWPNTWSNAACNPASVTEIERCGTNSVVSDWSPTQPASAAAIPPADSGIACTEGTSPEGLVTLCRTLPRNPSLAIPSQTCTESAADPTPVTGNGNISTTCSTVTTGPTNVTTCPSTWPITASSGNNWKASWCDSIPSGPTSDTLADVAEYYWKTDIRDPAYGNCTGGPVVSGASSTNENVCGNAQLTPREYNGGSLTGQYMNTYTLGLGASGLMQFQSDYKTATSGDFFSVKTGATANDSTCTWQFMGECNWPKPLSNKQTNIDDLWHAAVNGRGTYFSAGDPSAMAAGISSALQDVTIKEGALAAITVTSPNLTAGGSNSLFEIAFTAGSWTGEVRKYTVNETTGAISSTASWSARTLLDAKIAAGTHTSRKIFSYSPGGESASGAADNLRNFLWDNLSSTEKEYFRKPHIASLSQLCSTGTICLSTTDQEAADEENMLNFVRGDRLNEGPPADTTKLFRQRLSVLGDIVNSEAIYVKTPPWNYADHQYSAHKSANATRTGMVYVGANDGMLHAFNADTGQEAWAYIPRFLLPTLYQLADKNYGNFHRFFVDGTPVMGDICAENCGAGDTGTTWKTILVGGANQGGRGYYAIDITNPAAPKALWEFTHDNLGYSYGNPVITKLIDGTWVVLVASGYNNISPGDGEGRLFVLNANSGSLIRSISTGAGSTTTPSGLAKISAWANFPDNNNTAQRVYGGDLLGNLWRFDINAAGEDPPVYEAQRLAVLKDASGNLQPITSRPELALVKNHPVIYVGTGQFLGNADLSTSTRQSLYAIKDRLSDSDYGSPRPQSPAQTTPTPGNFVAQTMTSDDNSDGVVDTCTAGSVFCPEGRAIVSVSKNPVDWNTKDGWYVDFPVLGERVTSDIRLVQGTLAFTTNTPQSGACVPVGVSYSYFLDYMTGGYVEGTDGLAAFKLGDYLSSSPAIIRLEDGSIRGLFRHDTTPGPTSGGASSTPIPIAPPSFTSRRISWRELIID